MRTQIRKGVTKVFIPKKYLCVLCGLQFLGKKLFHRRGAEAQRIQRKIRS